MPNKIDDFLDKAGNKINDALKEENMSNITNSLKSGIEQAEDVTNNILGDISKTFDSAIDKISNKINGKK